MKNMRMALRKLKNTMWLWCCSEWPSSVSRPLPPCSTTRKPMFVTKAENTDAENSR